MVRGGIEVSATMRYYLIPELCVEGLSGSSRGVRTCLSLYHGMPTNYIDIYPWYQTRTIRRWRVMTSYMAMIHVYLFNNLFNS